MRSHLRMGTHPIHPMVVPLAIVGLPVMFAFDILHATLDNRMLWDVGAWIGILGGFGALVAIASGFVDMARIPNGTRAHKIGVYHTIIGFVILAAYSSSLLARWPLGSPPDGFVPAVTADLVGTLLIVAQGWLGGELVYKHHVGVPTTGQGAEPTPLDEKGVAAARRTPSRGERI